MGKYHPALEWGLGFVYLVLILFGAWKLGGWLFNEMQSFTPKKLAIMSLMLTTIPLVLLIVFGIADIKDAMHVSGVLTVLSFWISGPGLLAAGVWYLMTDVFG